ncbi:hypothetical protein B296_00058344 [Ensete ventricosum]|uniref:Uncharacterized protein n=1 Tax=Ensete ventricosum TaxID=4639 RepID=A0A426XMH9_ENSVE|nr:hypothetical protein B296_00058344 [Ensete ventricosum]
MRVFRPLHIEWSWRLGFLTSMPQVRAEARIGLLDLFASGEDGCLASQRPRLKRRWGLSFPTFMPQAKAKVRLPNLHASSKIEG